MCGDIALANDDNILAIDDKRNEDRLNLPRNLQDEFFLGLSQKYSHPKPSRNVRTYEPESTKLI